MYSVELSQRSDKYLEKLDSNFAERIKEKLTTLKTIPVPSEAKFCGRLKGNKIFRIRVGDFRDLYLIKEKEKIILVTKVNKRPRVYK